MVKTHVYCYWFSVWFEAFSELGSHARSENTVSVIVEGTDNMCF